MEKTQNNEKKIKLGKVCNCLSQILSEVYVLIVTTVDAVQNVNNSSGNFGFLTQMGDRIIQPLITVIKIYKTHSIGDFNYY
jgi:hypothetical protein